MPSNAVARSLRDIVTPLIERVGPLATALASTLAVFMQDPAKFRLVMLELIFGSHRPVAVRLCVRRDGPEVLWGEQHQSAALTAPGDTTVLITNHLVAERAASHRRIFEPRMAFEVHGMPSPTTIQTALMEFIGLVAAGHPHFLDGFETCLPSSARFLSGLFLWSRISRGERDESGEHYAVIHKYFPWNLPFLASRYPSVHTIISNFRLLELRLADPNDSSRVLATLALSWERGLELKCVRSADGQLLWHDATARPIQGKRACPIAFAGFASEFAVYCDAVLRLKVFNGSLALPRITMRLRGTSPDNSSWAFAVDDCDYPESWTDRPVGLFVPIDLIRKLLRDFFRLELSLSAPASRPTEFVLRFVMTTRAPALNGCLSRVLQFFVANELGSFIVVLHDFFEAMAADLARIAQCGAADGGTKTRVAFSGILKTRGRWPGRWVARFTRLIADGGDGWKLEYVPADGLRAVSYCGCGGSSVKPSGQCDFVVEPARSSQSKRRRLVFRAPSEQERDGWVSSMRSLRRQEAAPARFAQRSSPPQPRPPVSAPPARLAKYRMRIGAFHVLVGACVFGCLAVLAANVAAARLGLG